MVQLISMLIAFWLATGIVSLIWIIKFKLEVNSTNKLLAKLNTMAVTRYKQLTSKKSCYDGKTLFEFNKNDFDALKTDIRQAVDLSLQLEKIKIKIDNKMNQIANTEQALNLFLKLFTFGRVEVSHYKKGINDE